MTLATLLALLMSRRLGLRARLIAQAETKTLQLGDVRRGDRGSWSSMLATEAVVAVVLTVRFRDRPTTTRCRHAAWSGCSSAVSAFNNAGFSLNSDNLMGFVGDSVDHACPSASPSSSAARLSGDVRARRDAGGGRDWSVLTRITVVGSPSCWPSGSSRSWSSGMVQPGHARPAERLGEDVAAFTGGVMPRTAGFNNLDYGAGHARDAGCSPTR